jgi:hypothetical protein
LNRFHTDLTLWEHDVSRTAASCPSLSSLKEALDPDLRVRIITVQDTLGAASLFHGSAKTPPKALLAQCQILDDDDDDLQNPGNNAAASDPSLLGTIIFSLNCHAKRTSGVSSRFAETGLLIISNHIDLVRYVDKSCEVWIWRPWTEVLLDEEEKVKALICSRFAVLRV